VSACQQPDPAILVRFLPNSVPDIGKFSSYPLFFGINSPVINSTKPYFPENGSGKWSKLRVEKNACALYQKGFPEVPRSMSAQGCS
jgi:hypothetical protein